MSGMKSLKIMMLTLMCTASVSAYHNDCGPLEAGRWGLLAGVGAAPGFFKNRGFLQGVDPHLGITCPVDLGTGVTTLTCDNVYKILTTPSNVLLQDSCKLARFNKQFSNGVLHITGQVSYNICSNVQYFLEGVYDRAHGKCLSGTVNVFKAPDFCGVNCQAVSCETNNCSSSTCTITGTPFYTLDNTVKISNYQAYGGYLGVRYYCNRVWCDRFAFFTGFKFGMLHRKQICVNASFPAITVPLSDGTTTTNFTIAALSIPLVPYCKSNAISGGVQLGLDFCINDCWSVLVGAEFVVTSPFKANRNTFVPAPDPSGPGVITPGFGRNFPHIYNSISAPTGCLLQFPVWAGIRWEFDWCKRSCEVC